MNPNNIRIILSNKGYEEYKNFVGKHLSLKNDVDIIVENPELVIKGKNGVLMGWNNVIWDNEQNNKNIEIFETILNHLNEKDFSYRFANVGYEISDIYYNYCDNPKQGEKDLPVPKIKNQLNKFDDLKIKKELSKIINYEKGGSYGI